MAHAYADRYEIEAEIGAGAMATVYRARDRHLNRSVALKVIHPHLSQSLEVERRFEREVMAIASLSHENIIKLFDCGREERRLFLAMELVEGMNLEAVLERAGVLPNLVALSVFQQLFSALAVAHGQGIVHRDVKASNVLVDKTGCVRLADFGLARATDRGEHTQAGLMVGTPLVMAPEQIEGRTVDGKSDVFSAGVALYRSLYGVPPFPGETPRELVKNIARGEFRPMSETKRPVLPDFDALLRRCLRPKPEARPAAAECVERIQSLCAENGLVLERARMARFLPDPGAYIRSEDRELRERFTELCGTHSQAGRKVSAVKARHFAALLGAGPIPPRPSAPRSRRVASMAAAATAALLAVSGSGMPDPSWPTPGGPALPKSVPIAFPRVTPKAHLIAIGARPMSPQSEPSVKAGRFRRLPGTPPTFVRGSSTMPLPPARQGYLWVKTSPPFVEVRVDGIPFGKTPLSGPMSLRPGPHRLFLHGESTRDSAADVEVRAAETTWVRTCLGRALP